ncbi:MAG: helical backbone metal receptor [Woeseiaceae bacterium]
MRRALALALVAVALCACQQSDRSQTDARAYERIVSLAPNLTELVFAVGAEDALVGVSDWSDYPPEALELPVVGDAFTVDLEQLRLLDPDLLLVWESGTPQHAVDELRKTGYTVETIRTRGLDDVSTALLRVGELTARSNQAEAAAEDFQNALQDLREAQEGQSPIKVFYQVSARPLYTVNREHYVSELIEICGGVNVFSDLDDLAPGISVEAVVDRNPEVMLSSTDAGDDAFEEWKRWPAVSANLYGNLFLLPADEIARATPRLILAGGAMCLALQQARFNRDAFSGRR